jgi:hypothetical protein
MVSITKCENTQRIKEGELEDLEETTWETSAEVG